MKIRRLVLKNYYGAKKLDIADLDASVNVLYGMNGSGKSTILQAAVVLLSWLSDRLRKPD